MVVPLMKPLAPPPDHKVPKELNYNDTVALIIKRVPDCENMLLSINRFTSIRFSSFHFLLSRPEMLYLRHKVTNRINNIPEDIVVPCFRIHQNLKQTDQLEVIPSSMTVDLNGRVTIQNLVDGIDEVPHINIDKQAYTFMINEIGKINAELPEADVDLTVYDQAPEGPPDSEEYDDA